MDIKKVRTAYFSPSGTTEQVCQIINAKISCEKTHHNILDGKIAKKVQFAEGDILVLAMPVFGGRVPEYCLSSIKHLSGSKTPAILVAVYGNRDYDDALVEMADLVAKQGFIVIAAGAFIAQHSIFPKVAAGRPDESDKRLIEEFTDKAVKKIQELDASKLDTYEPPEIKGNRPYKKYMKNSMVPTGDGKCNNCRTCVNICPAGAISGEAPKKTSKSSCIMCTACIKNCPTKARGFHSPIYTVASKKFDSSCSKRKEPEIFI